MRWWHIKMNYQMFQVFWNKLSLSSSLPDSLLLLWKQYINFLLFFAVLKRKFGSSMRCKAKNIRILENFIANIIYVTNVNPRIPKAIWDCLIFITYIISTNYVRKFSNRDQCVYRYRYAVWNFKSQGLLIVCNCKKYLVSRNYTKKTLLNLGLKQLYW